MAMVVKNNMSAIATLNTLNKNSAGLSKSLAKVSSGQRVNGAADDASGYAISERMRVQVRALDQDNRNTQSGTSMMKVAEGAVSSTVDILKTLKEKVVSAANDDKTDSDRAAIQKELDQSIDQINDNANVTFNGKYLVDGSHNNAIKTGGVQNTMTNESMNKLTTGASTFDSLTDRDGRSLNINSTDTITISYVQEGKTYTASVAGSKSFNDLIDAANNADGVTKTVKDVDTDTQTAIGSDATITGSVNGGGIKLDAATAAKYAWNATSGNIDTTSPVTITLSNEAASNNGDAMPVNIKVGSDGTATAAVDSTGAAVTNTKSGGKVDATSTDISVSVSTDGTISFTNVTDLGANSAAYSGDIQLDADQTAALLKGLGATSLEVGPFDSEVLDGAKTTTSPQGFIGYDASGNTVQTADQGEAITFTASQPGVVNQISGVTIKVEDNTGKINKSANAVLDNFSESIRAEDASADNAIVLQVGTKANQAIKVGLTDMRAQALGLQAKDGATIQIGTQKAANAAINVLDSAIQKALDQQTTIGAVQSRLEYTSQNLTTASENVQASESTIRDADMAKEMTEYTKNNVLLQAAQSMLAQANQNSSAVLSLLQ